MIQLNRKILTRARRLGYCGVKTEMDASCPFCGIASGKIPASIVYEDSHVVAFMDLNPASIGHTLVVPREHWENIYEVPEDALGNILSVVKRVCAAVKKTVDADGIKVIQLNGAAAGQVVMHLHINVIPAFSKPEAVGKRRGRLTPEREELDEMAQKIRQNL
jgi:histidine triad (HIT) family protein